MCAKPTNSPSIDIDMLREEFNKLRAGLGDVADKLGDSTHSTLNQISDYLNNDSLSSRLASVEEQLSGLGARLKDTSKDAVARLETEISDKPIAALAIAFGIGLLAAGFIRRS